MHDATGHDTTGHDTTGPDATGHGAIGQDAAGHAAIGHAAADTPSAPPRPSARRPVRRLRRFFLGLALLLCLLGAACALTLWHLAPDPLERVLTWPVSPALLDRRGALIHARLSAAQEWCLPIPLGEMGRWLPRVLVAVEDRRFYSHPGVDVLALGRAVLQNLAAGRVRSGASTITSQLVRLSTPRKRTVAAKALEFVGAIKLERSLSKDDILEYYLNRAPFGGPVRGVEAAARVYFGKRAKELSLGEASLLVGLLKGPTAYRPDKNPQAALKRRQWIIAKVAKETKTPEDMTALALDEPLPRFYPVMPDAARHFADLAFATLPPEGGVARSTLDMGIQALLERTLRERLRHVGADVTAAGLVVENTSASIVAYVGNARFDPRAGSQWVDCALAPRSPGSTLKPFVYLAAMEDGHIIPATLLADTPLRLGGEAPRNFDSRYRGPVSAHVALADSLNIPAVRVLRMLGVRRALRDLREAGFSFLNRPDGDYGDSLVLGAGEVTALELARAYSTLARLGRDRPLLLRQAPPGGGPGKAGGRSVALEQYGSSVAGQPSPWTGARLAVTPMPSGLADVPGQLAAAGGGELPPWQRRCGAAAAFLVAEVLKDPGRLPFLAQLMQVRESAPVAFKTGTSFGLRDAWTAAHTPAYTVVVWFGRAGGGPDPRLVGISLAAPAAITILRTLGASAGPESGSPESGRPENTWYAPPEGAGRVTVCGLSGAAPAPFCPSARTVWHIPAVWRTAPCPMHVLRDGRTTILWPPELEDFTRKRFAGQDLSRAALIVSPLPGARYVITPGAKTQPIALKAEGVAYPVHWYVDGEYVGEQERADLPLYWLPAGGAHDLSLLDAEERVAAARVQVTDLAAGQAAEGP